MQSNFLFPHLLPTKYF